MASVRPTLRSEIVLCDLRAV